MNTAYVNDQGFLDYFDSEKESFAAGDSPSSCSSTLHDTAAYTFAGASLFPMTLSIPNVNVYDTTTGEIDAAYSWTADDRRTTDTALSYGNWIAPADS